MHYNDRTQILNSYIGPGIQFEKVEWNKLVRAEIKARKYELGQRRKLPTDAGATN